MSVSRIAASSKPIPAKADRRRRLGRVMETSTPAESWPSWTDRPFDVVALALVAVELSEGGAR